MREGFEKYADEIKGGLEEDQLDLFGGGYDPPATVERREPLPISEAWGYIADESDPSSNLEEGIEHTNLRKLPLCQVIVKNPIGQLWLVGKDVLQGARNGR